MTLRLVIADDHSVVLDGLRALLSLEPDLEVAALCTNGLEAMEAVDLHSPHVLIMDSTMPHCGGLEAHRLLRGRGVKVPTVILSATLSDETILGCLQASVEGIVLKESAASILIDAVRAVAGGERWIPPELTARAAELLARKEDSQEEGLTSREREIAVEVANGSSNKRVAADLGIAQSTVKLHLHNAFKKLGVRNRVELSLLARERGWI
jgi:two-component system nitrate/nitrite response regulator NarL